MSVYFGMAPAEHITWKDSAAVGAALFLNFFALSTVWVPFPLAATPFKLLFFSLSCGGIAAAAYYLVALGAAAAVGSGLPMESRFGKAVYLCSVVAVAVPLCDVCAGMLSWAFDAWWSPTLGLGRSSYRDPVGTLLSLVWLGWATWIASRGRAVVARAARVWAWAGLAILTGCCFRFRAEIWGVLRSPATRWSFSWHDYFADISSVFGHTLALVVLAAALAPTARDRLKRVSVVGIGGGLAAAMLLGSLMLAGLDQRVGDGDLVRFHILMRSGASPYGEARYLVAAMTMLPLIRLAASAILEALRSLRVPTPGWATFTLLAAYAWHYRNGSEFFVHWNWGSVLAGIIAGVLSGAGLAALLGWRSRRSAVRRRSESVGLLAGLGYVFVASLVDWWNVSFTGQWNLDLLTRPYLASMVVTAASDVLFEPREGGR